MKVTYQSVKNYYSKVRLEGLKFALDTLERVITDARDNEHVPVYLTKQRIKAADSVYLKTKRKERSLDQINDYAGLRILCLFEQDILPVHMFLLERLRTFGFKFTDAEAYNWDDKKEYYLLKESLENMFRKPFEGKMRLSGYRSIHYVVKYRIGRNYYSVEIQLRTLLQDVWGELEHALCYKQGSIHPHIRESFRLLAHDLDTNDALIRNLKEISDKERVWERFQVRYPVSSIYFEPERLPELFTTGALKSKYAQYKKYITDSLKGRLASNDWVPNARNMYDDIADDILRSNSGRNSIVQYWIKGEDAYLDFVSGALENALSKYIDLAKSEKDNPQYAPYFRTGEIYFKQGDLVNALVAFDACDELLQSNAHHVNAYKVKTRLANVYWSLGHEYCERVIEQIEVAKSIVETHRSEFDEETYYKMINNLCWYRLEKFIVTKNEEDYKKAREAFRKLERPLTSGKIDASNYFDTAAWFCYHTYLKSHDVSYLKRAKQYIEDAATRQNISTLVATSMNIQRNHLQEILGSK